MKTWNPYPLVRLFFPFAMGIIAAIYAGFSTHIPWEVFTGLLLMTGCYVFYFARKISYRTRWVFGVVLYLMLFCCGYELTLLRTPSSKPDHFLHVTNPRKYTLVRITAPPQLREKCIKAETEMMVNGDSSGLTPCSGQLLLYFATDSLAEKLTYGDLVLVQKVPEIVAPTANPAAFNYKQYLANRGVYHQLFVSNREWKRIGQGAQNPLYRLAYRARAFILDLLINNGLAGREFAVTSALLIGYTDKLDADLLSDYSGTGAMHILSVSGMHVGLIYVVLNLLLFFFDKLRYGKFPKAALLLIFISVSYTHLTLPTN
jgi:competence protein ComEC